MRIPPPNRRAPQPVTGNYSAHSVMSQRFDLSPMRAPLLAAVEHEDRNSTPILSRALKVSALSLFYWHMLEPEAAAMSDRAGSGNYRREQLPRSFAGHAAPKLPSQRSSSQPAGKCSIRPRTKPPGPCTGRLAPQATHARRERAAADRRLSRYWRTCPESSDRPRPASWSTHADRRAGTNTPRSAPPTTSCGPEMPWYSPRRAPRAASP